MAKKLRATLAAQVITTIKVHPSASPALTRGVDHRALETDILDSVLMPEDVSQALTVAAFMTLVEGAAVQPTAKYLLTDAAGGAVVVTGASSTTIEPWASRGNERGFFDLLTEDFTADAANEQAIPYYDSAEVSVAIGDSRRHTIGGVIRLFEALANMSAPIPAPTGAAGDVNWKEISPSQVVSYQFSYPLFLIQSWVTAGTLVPGFRYYISTRGGGASAVVATALSTTEFEPFTAILLDTPRVAGSFDAATDTFTPNPSGGSGFTEAQVRATPLTGLSTATTSPVVATDTVLEAFGKLEARVAAAAGPPTAVAANPDGTGNVTLNGGSATGQNVYKAAVSSTVGWTSDTASGYPDGIARPTLRIAYGTATAIVSGGFVLYKIRNTSGNNIWVKVPASATVTGGAATVVPYGSGRDGSGNAYFYYYLPTGRSAQLLAKHYGDGLLDIEYVLE